MTGPRPGRCGGGWSACPAPIRTIRATGGCATAATQTIICSGSPDRRPKPRRSNSAWREFLRDELKLELSQDKTLITHARTRRGPVSRLRDHRSSTTTRRRPAVTDAVNGQIALRVPRDVIKAKCAPYLHRGKPAKQKALINGSDHTIVATFGAVYRGIVQYYLLAGDVFRLHRLRWVMETSMLKTLAGKHRSSVSKMAAKHKAKIQTPHGPRTCFEARIERDGRQPLVARFGGIPLQRQKTADGHRPSADPGRLSAQGTDRPTPRGHLRDLRANGQRASPPRPQARRSRHTRTAPAPTGPRPWRTGDAKPSWSATPATTVSIPGNQPHRSRSSHWRAG